MNRDKTSNDTTRVFRGRSMQEAVNQLKIELGPDAVIVGTTRGSDRQGRYVEITANIPAPVETPASTSPRMGNPLASAAYASTARSTIPASKPSSSATTKDGPFADRAKWLAEQVAARAGASAGMSSPVDELLALRNGALPKGIVCSRATIVPSINTCWREIPSDPSSGILALSATPVEFK